jgi:probable rRNA maturation factor
MRLDLTVQNATRRRIPEPREMRRWARAALTGLRRARAAVLVRIVDEPESAALNSRYRGKPGPTNVLSFSYDARPADALGDIVICAPLVAREARENNKKIKDHWAHLVVHAILHLRGYDHQHEPDAARMEALETRIMRRLGIPDPYAQKL